MRTSNSFYFNAYRFRRDIIIILVGGFLFACSGENKTKQVLPIENQIQVSDSAININTASVEELEKLPRVGRETARAIVEQRERFGKFHKPEHLILVRRISDAKFRELRGLIKVE
ncbi:MAG: ComEA family DNA-binding protein [Pyrinomonadaceae bacterium]